MQIWCQRNIDHDRRSLLSCCLLLLLPSPLAARRSALPLGPGPLDGVAVCKWRLLGVKVTD